MTDSIVNPEHSVTGEALEEESTSSIIYSPPTDNIKLHLDIEDDQNIETNSTNNTNKQESSELKIKTNWLNDLVHISIESFESINDRIPCDICCVIDTSGSMSSGVTIHGEYSTETGGLTQLDLAIHALKTIIHSLTENDRLSIVSFSDEGNLVLKLTKMDDNGRTNALNALEKLESNGSTNLWDGLKTGLDVLFEEQRTSGCNVALFLLTDGCPSEIPAEGHLPALNQYKKQTNFTCSINTFGFGYSLDSKLLEDLAIIGNSGSYAFIPDSSFVGTVFINSISNLLTTAATNLKLSIGNIQPSIDTSSIYIYNYSTDISQHQFSEENGLCINLGNLVFGQSRDVIIPMTYDQYKKLNIILDYESAYGEKKKQLKKIINIDQNQILLNQQKYRLEFVYYVRKAYQYSIEHEENLIDNDPKIIDDLQKLENTIRNHSNNDNYLNDLLTDLTGQIREALSKSNYFTKWGKHYLLSITRAHLFQQCNNFKDPGVQHYGQGDLFNRIRDEMDTIFCALPAPTRPTFNELYDSDADYVAGGTSTVNMSAFNDADGPCFHGSCLVKLYDGSIKFVKDIQRGDQLYPHGGKVNYILKTICHNNKSKMILFDSGLIITPWHPIRLNDINWIFPYSFIPSITNITCEAIYSFALDYGHTIWINDIECVTLAHQFNQDIVRHNYYGTQRIIQDLRILDQQQNSTGYIEIQPTWIARNKRTGLVNSIRQPQDINTVSN